MKNSNSANFEFSKENSSISPFPVCQTVTTATQKGSCQSCGRDLSQPNLLPPSNSRSGKNVRGVSRGHGICSQCGGLGAGLLDELCGY